MPTAEPSSAGSKQPLMHTKFTLNFTSFGFFRHDSFSMPKSLSILCCILAPTPAFSSPQFHERPAVATVTSVTTAIRSYLVCPVPQWFFKPFPPCGFFCPGLRKAHGKGPNGFHWPTDSIFFSYMRIKGFFCGLAIQRGKLTTPKNQIGLEMKNYTEHSKHRRTGVQKAPGSP